MAGCISFVLIFVNNLVFIGIGGKPMPVLKKDQEGDLFQITCTKKSSSGSDHANAELSDAPTMQRHNGPSELKTVASLAPVHIPRSGSCPSKIPLLAHRDARSRSKTLNPTMTATDHPVSRRPPPISTANPQPPEKTSNVIPSTAKPVSTSSMTTTDGPFSGILQPTLPATSESYNEIPSATGPTGQSKTHASKKARNGSASGISQQNSTANSDPAHEMFDESLPIKAMGPSPSNRHPLLSNPPKSSSSPKTSSRSKIPVHSSSKKKKGEHARSS